MFFSNIRNQLAQRAHIILHTDMRGCSFIALTVICKVKYLTLLAEHCQFFVAQILIIGGKMPNFLDFVPG